MAKLVIIDAGHGGMDPGAVVGDMKEKDYNLPLALRLAADLTFLSPSTRVLFTRTEDIFVPLVSRVEFANSKRADLFISIHHNTGGGSGFESHIHPNASTYSRYLQDALQQRLLYVTSDYVIPLRRPKTSNFSVLRNTKMPAIVIEALFMDDVVDIKLIKNPVWNNRLSYSIAEVLINAK